MLGLITHLSFQMNLMAKQRLPGMQEALVKDRAGEMAQLVNVVAIKAGNLNSTPGAHVASLSRPVASTHMPW